MVGFVILRIPFSLKHLLSHNVHNEAVTSGNLLKRKPFNFSGLEVATCNRGGGSFDDVSSFSISAANSITKGIQDGEGVGVVGFKAEGLGVCSVTLNDLKARCSHNQSS